LKENHPFLFRPGIWLGEGKVKLNVSPEEMKFMTRWNLGESSEEGPIKAVQEVQISGLSEIMTNQFSVFKVVDEEFEIELENQNLGKVIGKGIIRPKIISWEFRLNSLGFEGFELYEKEEDDTYSLHAEYATKDDFRTIIQGKIWLQKSK